VVSAKEVFYRCIDFLRGLYMEKVIEEGKEAGKTVLPEIEDRVEALDIYMKSAEYLYQVYAWFDDMVAECEKRTGYELPDEEREAEIRWFENKWKQGWLSLTSRFKDENYDRCLELYAEWVKKIGEKMGRTIFPEIEDREEALAEYMETAEYVYWISPWFEDIVFDCLEITDYTVPVEARIATTEWLEEKWKEGWLSA